MSVIFKPLPTETVRTLQAGGPDAYGNLPERRISDGDGVPCRHCLKQVPEGRPYLVVACRPFASLQAYAETGPVFLCAETCEPAALSRALPDGLQASHYIVRGYNAVEQIVYGTGSVVPASCVAAQAETILANEAIAFVHVRSATNNCYQVRIERG